MDWLEFMGRLAPVISALSGFLGLAIGWIVSARKSRTQRERDLAATQDAIANGVKVLLRSKVVDAYERYVGTDEWPTVERRHEVTEAYEAYKALGGNGTVTQMYESFSELPTKVVGRRGES